MRSNRTGGTIFPLSFHVKRKLGKEKRKVAAAPLALIGRFLKKLSKTPAWFYSAFSREKKAWQRKAESRGGSARLDRTLFEKA